jgi:hypothetical protein
MVALFKEADHALHEMTSKARSVIGISEETITAVARIMAENGSDEEIDKVLSKK